MGYLSFQPLKTYVGLIILGFICIACSPAPTPPPPAQAGVLDLTTWDFTTQGNVNLAGEWEFYWQRLLTPSDFVTSTLTPSYQLVPGPWVNYEVSGQKLPGHGYATFRLTVKLRDYHQLYGLKLPVAGTAYKIWLDDEIITTVGVVGSSLETAQANYHPQVVFFLPSRPTLHFTIQVSNFHDRQGGLWHQIELGPANSIQTLREYGIALDLMIFGGLLLMGLYHLALYAFRPQEKSPLYFGLLCLLVALRTIITGEKIFSQIWPTLPWEGMVKLEFLTFSLSTPFFLTFIAHIYPQETHPRIVKVGQLLGLLFSILIILTPARVYSEALTLYQIITLVLGLYAIYIFTLAAIRGHESSWFFITGFILFFITVINDILYANMVIQTTWLAPFGFFFFIFVQAAILARRFMKAFNYIETLSQQQQLLREELQIANQNLQVYNENLAQKVEERTHALTETLEHLKTTQSQLVMSEKMAVLGQLVANIAHEINTPLGAIRASALNNHDALNDILAKLPPLLQTLPPARQNDFFALLAQSLKSTQRLSTREARQAKRKLQQQLEAAAIQEAANLADWLIDMEIYQDIEPFFPLFLEPQAETLVEVAYQLSGLHKSNRNIVTAVERADKVVFALKNYAQTHPQGQKVEAQLLDGLETVLTLYHRQMKDKIEIIRRYMPMLPIACYPDELNQVWSNLIHNALQAMSGPGQLILTVYTQTRADQPHAVVEITDNGAGIPPEIMSRIFEPFFTTKAAGEGSGLGLDICQQIISKHNGLIEAMSQPGQTTFRVWLPFTDLPPNPPQ